MEWIIGLFVVWLIGEMTGASSKGKRSGEARDKNNAVKGNTERSEEAEKKSAIERARRLKELEEEISKPVSPPTPHDSQPNIQVPDRLLQSHVEKLPRTKDLKCFEVSDGNSDLECQPKEGSSIRCKDLSASVQLNGPEGGSKLDLKETVASHFSVFGVFSLWHITHRNNLKTILSSGILSNSGAFSEFQPTDISNHEVQKWRDRVDPFYNRAVHDYAPLYINVRNPMLYVKKHVQNELCLIEVSLSLLESSEFVFTDGNAASRDTKFYKDVKDLAFLPWDVIRASYWNDFPDGKRKRCSEVLVYPYVDPAHIVRIHCASMETLGVAKSYNCDAVISKNMFF
ncbi:DUF4433 domain-containing protein [Aromatoleum bremense]|uniref:DUF4433 domain-containing protein n=1 Tax=Aromatoleum bremense TaxID=76115 RepID=A0ABX1NR95_9RHOO|nr:DUF4433 domain-containing protein [Aromatoleum bremense]NMG14227.1 DUF4433 domain-containing protein [Aromatoleum bremense]QTQ34007.1 putative protein DUf4433 [Aromatoleum bremense]